MSNANTTELPIITTYRLAVRLLDEYGLKDQGWTFDISSSKRRVACCKYGLKRIEFSQYFLHIGPEKIHDVLLHEIAHALVGRGHGHNEVWKQKAIELGIVPNRCTDARASATPNYVVICPKCKQRWYRHRLKKAMHRAKHCGVVVEIYRVKSNTGD